MFGMIVTRRGVPAARRDPGLNRIILFPRGETTGPDDLEISSAGSPRGRQAAEEPFSGLKIFEPESRTARARRILDIGLTYIPHPSFDDPGARDAILGPEPDPVDGDAPRKIEPAVYRDSDLADDRGARACRASRRPTYSAR